MLLAVPIIPTGPTAFHCAAWTRPGGAEHTWPRRTCHRLSPCVRLSLRALTVPTPLPSGDQITTEAGAEVDGAITEDTAFVMGTATMPRRSLISILYMRPYTSYKANKPPQQSPAWMQKCSPQVSYPVQHIHLCDKLRSCSANRIYAHLPGHTDSKSWVGFSYRPRKTLDKYLSECSLSLGSPGKAATGLVFGKLPSATFS